MTLLCVLPGPTEVRATESDDRPTRWCFTCRRHRMHTWMLLGDREPLAEFMAWPELDGYAAAAVLASLSWYDPVWSLRCPAGHAATEFPGRVW